jgi:hypothetical protein
MAKSNLRIILRHPQERKYDETNFWTRFYEATDRVRGEFVLRPDDNILAGRIKQIFPHELKRFLTSINSPDLVSGYDTKAGLSSSITIAVEYLKEGSLEIGLIIEPVEKLGRLFDNNFDYFEVFLRSYIPLAFHRALSPTYEEDFIGWHNVVNQLETEIIPTNDFQNRFQTNSSTKSKTLSSKANWLWIASNTTLIVPVILSSFILYFFHEDVKYRETQLNNQYNEILEQKDKIIEHLNKISDANEKSKQKND